LPIFWKYRLCPKYLVNEISPYVVTGNNVGFLINNIEPYEYCAEINNMRFMIRYPYKSGTGETQITQQLKPENIIYT
jgi:hypothetical protein